jgi:hypothetical protein
MSDKTFSEPFGPEPLQIPITDVFNLHSVPARDVREALERALGCYVNHLTKKVSLGR